MRGQIEHCILAVRGHPKLKVTNQSTLLRAPKREHSRKPDGFYKLVDEICAEPKLDLFGREQRNGWTVHGTNQLRKEKTPDTDGQKIVDSTSSKVFNCPGCSYRSQAEEDPVAELKATIANIAHVVSHIEQDSKHNSGQSTGTRNSNSLTREAPG